MFSMRRWLRQQFPQVRRIRPPRGYRPQLDPLEDRRLLAVYTVDTTEDILVAGKLTLREAIQSSNASQGVLDTINFAIDNGLQVIRLNQKLPAIDDAVVLDAIAPVAFPTQKIRLNGAVAGVGVDGLTVNDLTGAAGAHTTVKGLTIVSFDGNGIVLNGGENVLQGNYIGIDDAAGGGDPSLRNGKSGIEINSSKNVIGGRLSSSKEANVIAANSGDGIFIAPLFEGNVIKGNYIGTTPSDDGAADRGNKLNGINNLGNSTTIGSNVADERNIISRNSEDGIRITGILIGGTKILGNYIGTDPQGSKALPNKLNGVHIIGSPNNTIGGTTAFPGSAPGNLISGNTEVGILIEIIGAENNQVLGNLIGTNLDGTGALGNTGGGVVLSNSRRNTIGGITAVPGTGAGNVISGNIDGVMITGQEAKENKVLGNLIGTDAMGTMRLENSTSGVYILDGASANTIGGSAPLSGNVISGNGRFGIEIQGGSSNEILGNLIGTDISGGTPLANSSGGVLVDGGNANKIGGPTSTPGTGAGNVISGNGTNAPPPNGNGVRIQSGSSTEIKGNLIGTNRGGTVKVPNQRSGIQIDGAAAAIGNLIGGPNVTDRNIISGNNDYGIDMNGEGAKVQSNYIGPDINNNPANPLGNGKGAILKGKEHFLDNSNAIAFNLGDGIIVAEGTNHTIRNNAIYLNGGTGVRVLQENQGTLISQNFIWNNTSLGIDVGPAGVTTTNIPFVTFASVTAGSTRVAGVLFGSLNTTYVLEFYGNTECDPSGFGEGEGFLGSFAVTTNSFGYAIYSSSLPFVYGTYITATATDPGGSTSEFSLCQCLFKTIAWPGTDSYESQLAQVFVAEGRIGNTVTGGGTFEVDIGPNTSMPAETADYPWNQSPAGHPFTLTYDATTGLATFDNNGTVVRYSLTWSGDPLRDTIFVRTRAVKNNSQIRVGNLELFTTDLGIFVPVPFSNGSKGPASVEATGPSGLNSLQIYCAWLQRGFVLRGVSYWTYATSGPDAPSLSELAFQLKVGTWNGAGRGPGGPGGPGTFVCPPTGGESLLDRSRLLFQLPDAVHGLSETRVVTLISICTPPGLDGLPTWAGRREGEVVLVNAADDILSHDSFASTLSTSIPVLDATIVVLFGRTDDPLGHSLWTPILPANSGASLWD